jgi:hypothetical protein
MFQVQAKSRRVLAPDPTDPNRTDPGRIITRDWIGPDLRKWGSDWIASSCPAIGVGSIRFGRLEAWDRIGNYKLIPIPDRLGSDRLGSDRLQDWCEGGLC